MKNDAHSSRQRLLPSLMGAAALLVTWGLGDGGLFLLLGFGAWIAASETAWRFLTVPGPTPYPLMLFSPLLLVQYASVGDFRIRLACFFMLVYIWAIARRRFLLQRRISLAALGPRRLWLSCFVVFALAAAVLYAQNIHLSGDEPHYIMIAQSLVEDGDFDLKNNLESRSYFSYLPVEVRFHGSIRAGAYHSFHMPGISFLLVPFYFLFNLLAGAVPGHLFFRLAAAFINAFFALGLFLALRRMLVDEENDGLFIFFLFTFPLLFHAVHLFPELPAAALVIFACLSLQGGRGHFLSGLFLALVPWFHLKFAVAALLMALYASARIMGREEPLADRARRLAIFFAAPALSLVLLGLYSKVLYGSFDPRVISPEGNFLAIPLKFKVETLLSFFLDQRDGLLVYAPLFLLAFLAFKKEVRERIRDFPLLAALFLAHVLFHAFTTVRGGYSPAARPTLFVAWIMMVFLAAYRRHASGGQRTLFNLLCGLGIFASVWLLYYPLFLYQPVTREVSQRASGLLLFLGSRAVNLASLFPSFLKKPNAAYLPNWIWLGLLTLGLVAFYFGKPWPSLKKTARALYAALGILVVAAVCLLPHVHLKTRYSAAGLSFFSNSRNFVHKQEMGGFRMLAGKEYDLFFDLDGSAADRVNLWFSRTGNVNLKVRNGRHVLAAEERAEEFRVRTALRNLKKFSLGKKTLVHVGIESAARRENDFFFLHFE